MSSQSYIHTGDMKKKLIDRFHHLIYGQGITVPRVAVAKAVNDVITYIEELENEQEKNL